MFYNPVSLRAKCAKTNWNTQIICDKQTARDLSIFDNGARKMFILNLGLALHNWLCLNVIMFSVNWILIMFNCKAS